MKVVKKILRICTKACLILIVVALLAASGFLVYRGISQNNIRNSNRITTENGIEIEETIIIGEIKQYINIRGENKDNPMMLVLHGGPGDTLTPFSYLYQKPLEQHFTIVNYDQRNAGKTYHLNDSKEVFASLSFSRIVDDVKELVQYLITTYNQDKIIILGHSWGTAIGSDFISKYPELVKSYIGVGQLVNSIEAEQLSHDKTLEAAIECGNTKDVETLKNLTGYLINEENFSKDSLITERKLMQKYLMDVVKEQNIMDVINSPYYSIKDLTYYLKDILAIQKPLLDYLGNEFDLRDYSREYEVPTYYISGDHDWITPYVLVQDYYNEVIAPKKDYILIKDAGHSPMLDQPELFVETIIDLLS